MNIKVPFVTPIKFHLLIGILLGLWVYLFLVFIGPFDVFPLKLVWRATIMIGYGLIFSFSYFAIIPLQNWLNKRLKKWDIILELSVVLFVFFINFLPTYFYYTSDWVQGEYSFLSFLSQIYLPTSFILIPLLLMSRWIVFKLTNNIKVSTNKIDIVGKNKLDKLNILFADLICIKSSNNYIEIYYQKNGQLQKKLLRLTLKEIQIQIPDLIKTHRSFLINRTHFIEWKNKKSIILTHLEVPVSDKYKNQVLGLLKSYP